MIGAVLLLLLLPACMFVPESELKDRPGRGEDSQDVGEGETGIDADDDDDGYPSSEDCDDANPAVHPDADEVCGGGDEDCDGQTDEAGALGELTWYADVDGDGFGDPASFSTTCTPPDAAVEDATDCDDGDARRYPGAEEDCGDGVVNDCADSADEATEACAWYGSVSAASADAKLTGDAETEYAGSSLGGGGDLNGDGCADLVLGSYSVSSFDGRVWVVFGPVLSESVSAADAILSDSGSGGNLGVAVANDGDLNGDGYDDLLTGMSGYQSNRGAVWIDYSPVSGGTDVSAADALLTGEISSSLGMGVALRADIDGDETSDILTSGQGSDGREFVSVFLSPPTGTVSASTADAILTASATSTGATSVADAGDIDGDGMDDILIGAYGDDTAGVNAGAAFVFLGTVRGSVSLADADARVLADDAGDYAGYSVAGAGDADGDGYADMLVGAYFADGVGVTYLLAGIELPLGLLADARATLQGASLDDYAGISVDFVGDMDLDGFDDVLVGAHGADIGDAYTGSAYVVRAPLSGVVGLGSADLVVSGEAANDELGCTVSRAGDTNGDGIPDLMATAPLEDSGGAGAGAVYVVLGRGY